MTSPPLRRCTYLSCESARRSQSRFSRLCPPPPPPRPAPLSLNTPNITPPVQQTVAASENHTTGHTKCENIDVNVTGDQGGGYLCVCPDLHREVSGICLRNDRCASALHSCTGNGVECKQDSSGATDECICKTGFAEVSTNENRSATDAILCEEYVAHTHLRDCGLDGATHLLSDGVDYSPVQKLGRFPKSLPVLTAGC